MTATVREPRALKRRRIIERPRLFAFLDESRARVRTLVAPAGYGKTTLAEQWVARDGRCSGRWTIIQRVLGRSCNSCRDDSSVWARVMV